MGLRSWLSIRFEDRRQEKAFKDFHQEKLDGLILIAAFLEALAIITVTLPRLRAERENNGFSWASDDPRTIFFGAWFGLFVLNALSLVAIVLLKRRGFLPCLDYEAVIGTESVCFWPFLPFLTPYRIAVMCGRDAEDVWFTVSEYPIQTFIEQELIMILGIIALCTGATMFVPLRMHFTGTINFVLPLSYVVATYGVGSPLTSVTKMPVMVYLFLLSPSMIAGARRIEESSRKLWAALGKSEHTLQKSQEKVLEQKQINTQLEASNQALHGLMHTICDVVFQAGDNLCVVQSSSRLDALLGPMRGLHLEDALENEEQRNRLRRVLNPMMSEQEEQSQSQMSTVLVPPVRFVPNVLAGDSTRVPFEAEVIAADTHLWQNNDQGRWRYLVGLKVVRPAEPVSEGRDSFSLDESFDIEEMASHHGSHSPGVSSSTSPTVEPGIGTFDAEVRVADGLLVKCSTGWNLLFGQQMEGKVIFHFFVDVQQVMQFQKAVQAMQQFGKPEMLRSVTLRSLSAGGDDLRSSMRITQHDNDSCSSTTDTSSSQSIHVHLHGPVRIKRHKDKATVDTKGSLSGALQDIPEVDDDGSQTSMAQASAPGGLGREMDDGVDNASFASVPVKLHKTNAKRQRNAAAAPLQTVGPPRRAPSTWRQANKRTIEFALKDFLQRFLILPEENRRSCCPFHTVIDVVKEVTEVLAERRCEVDFSAFVGWQCLQCDTCNEEVCYCVTCGMERLDVSEYVNMMHSEDPQSSRSGVGSSGSNASGQADTSKSDTVHHL